MYPMNKAFYSYEYEKTIRYMKCQSIVKMCKEVTDSVIVKS